MKRQAPAELLEGRARAAARQRRRAADFAAWVDTRVASSGCSEPEAIAAWFAVFAAAEWLEGKGARREAARLALVKNAQERLRYFRKCTVLPSSVQTTGRRRDDADTQET